MSLGASRGAAAGVGVDDEARLLDHRGWRSPLARRIVALTVVFSSLITLAATAWQLFGDYRWELDGIETRVHAIERSHVPALVESLWVLDDVLVSAQIDGLHHEPVIASVLVEGVNGRQWRVGRADDGSYMRFEIPLVRTEAGRTHVLGTLHLAAGLDRVYRQLLRKVGIILLGNGAKTFLVAGFILFLFHRLVGRHLRDLADHAGAQSPMEAATPLVLAGRRARAGEGDELDRLVTAYNEMLARGSRHADEQRAARREIARRGEALQIANRDLEGEVEERRRAEAALRRRSERLDLLNEVTSLANRNQAFEAAAESILAAICRACGWPVAMVRPLNAWDAKLPAYDLVFLHPGEDGGLGFDERAFDTVEHMAFARLFKGLAMDRPVPLAPGDLAVLDLPDGIDLDRGLLVPIVAGERGLAWAVFLWYGPLDPDKEMLDILRLAGVQLGHVFERDEAAWEMSEQSVVLNRSKTFLEQVAEIISLDLRAVFQQLTAATATHATGDRDTRSVDNAIRWLGNIIHGVESISKTIQDDAHFDLLPLDDALDQVRAELAETAWGCHLVIDADPLPTVFGDMSMLRRLFWHLAENAVRFRHSTRSPRLEIRVDYETDATLDEMGSELPVVALAFSDNGVGFDEAIAEQIFVSFRRAPDADERSGDGVGLALCRQIVERHGGQISGEGHPGEGATFHVVLPYYLM